MTWRYVGARVIGPHATNLEMGSLAGRDASHSGEGNSRVVKDREDHQTCDGVCDCGTEQRMTLQPGISATSRRECDENTERKRRSMRTVGKRKSEGFIRAMTTGNGELHPDPEEQRKPVRR